MDERKASYKPFKITFDRYHLAGDVLSNDDKGEVLVLHGAGEQGRMRFRFFREYLYDKGISSCAFDFMGHGDSEGESRRTSLFDRTRQARKVIQTQRLIGFP
ncbi:MAG: alpha/beta hydrolase [Deltaproteobacteria bacterium]|nr:alpha/beta hydrolase [Deltaproteobacteria bacterium]MBW2153203.1 alpha/beta hydrolase [Deltaproteobacteria bacterium]